MVASSPSVESPPAPRAWLRVTGAALAAAAALLLQLPSYDRTAVPMDEGHLAAAASRLLAGDVLYRDVHTGIGPLVYHVTAALFQLFGRDLLVTRIAQAVINAAVAALLWILARRVVRLHWAALAPALYLLVVAVGFPVLTMFNYSSLALLLALAALLLLVLHLERGTLATGVGLGTLLAATALTKQNYGALCLLAAGLAIVWNRPALGKQAARSLGALAASVLASGAVVALACVGYFAWRGALFELVDSTIVQVGETQLDAFDNPIPPLLGAHPRNEPRFVFLYTPPALFDHMLRGGKLLGRPVPRFVRELSIRISYGIPLLALAAAPLVLWFTRRQVPAGVQRERRTMVLFAALFFLGIFPSAIWSHLAFVVAPAFLALAIAGDGLESVLRARAPARRWLAPAVALSLSGLALVTSARTGSAVHDRFPTPLGLPRATLFVTPSSEKLYRGALRFIAECAPPGAAIFVAPDIPLLYHLADRANPTPYDLTIPGNVDGEVIIERLEADQTRCVVYNPRMYPEFPPFATLFPQLDRYLRTRFSRAAVIAADGNEWHGLVRLEAKPPE